MIGKEQSLDQPMKRALPWSQTSAAALILVAATALPLAVPAPLGLAPLLLLATALAGLGPVLGDRRAAFLALGRLSPALAVFALTLLWSLAGLAWSIAPERTLMMALRLAGTAACGLLLLAAALDLDPGQRDRLAWWLCIGTIFGTALLLLESATDLALLRAIRWLFANRDPVVTLLNRAATLLVLLMWPVAVVIWRRRGWAMAAAWLIVALIVIARLASASALAACLLGAAMGLAAYAWPVLATWSLAGASALAILAAPLAGRLAVIDMLRPWVKASGMHRLVIWNFVSERIGDHPFIGWGFDTARLIPGGERTVEIATRDGLITGQLLPLHPHNAALQWWLELGMPGALLGAALVVVIARAIAASRWNRVEYAAAQALFAAGLVVSMLSYGIWQFWWQAALWFAAALAIAVFPAAPGRAVMKGP